MKGQETPRRSANGTIESRLSSTSISPLRNGAAWRGLLVAGAILLVPCLAIAQSTLAAVYGTVYDEQRGVIPGATITLKNLDTGQVRAVLSDGTGNFRLVGLPPGQYEMQTALAGFVTDVRSNVQLTISAEAEHDVVLEVEGVTIRETVAGVIPFAAISKTALGRTFTTKEIDELPVAARDFANLALLTPGILANPINTTVVTSGMIGRNNAVLVDGLSLDDHLTSNARSGVSLDSVKEFVVLSNSFSAEYGHAAGAVISVLTKSGINEPAGRVVYYHRDDGWNATSAAARLTNPPDEKTRLEQQILGGFFGGAVVRNRAFFFGSVEHTRRDSENIVTSGVLQVFRPGAPTPLPAERRRPQLFARGDIVLGTANTLILRSRLDRTTVTNVSIDRLPGLSAPERRLDRTIDDRDLAVLDNHVLGARGLNEFRFQFARRMEETNVDNYCPGCATYDYPGLFLGKANLAPERRTERRWQFANTLTYLVSDRLGDHAFKGGVDASAIDINGFQPANFDGTWTFTVDRPFAAADRATYPRQYQRNGGEPFYDVSSQLYTVFFQDQWQPASRLTLNLGVRWDYEDAVRVARDADNIAPRIGVAFDPSRDGRTTIRGNYGVYYDAVLFMALVNTIRGSQVFRTQVDNPGYPDPYGFNPNRAGAPTSVAPNGRRFADSIRTPYTEQASVGLRHVRGPLSMTADAVWARGRNLLRLSDGNYPNLDDPLRTRPDSNFQQITVRETEGRSSYRALLIGVQKPHSRHYSYAVAYTLSRAERDTEDWDFMPQDQRDWAAEWGPSASDARHRLAASANVDLGLGVRLTSILTARSALPYNVTTGDDNNRDGSRTDRPAGVSRNSARGGDSWQVDARLSKAFGFGARRIELIAEVFNLFNHSNWIAFDGVARSTTFGRPTDAAAPREVQLGIRVDF